MYKLLKIGEEDYKLEYSIEASLYADCLTSVTDIMNDISAAESSADVKQLFSGLANIPATTLTMFYAGLLEAHGPEGDGRVCSIADAKKLLAKYLKEHKDDKLGSFYGVMTICVEQMKEDDFFGLTGLNEMFTIPAEEEKKKANLKKSEATGS